MYKITFPIKQTSFIRHRQPEEFIFNFDSVGAQPIIQVGGRGMLRQKDREFKVSFSYIVTPHQKKTRAAMNFRFE